MQLDLKLTPRGTYITGGELKEYYRANHTNADKLRRVVKNMREILGSERVGEIDIEMILPKGDIKFSSLPHTLPSIGERNSITYKEWEILYDLVEQGFLRRRFLEHRFYCKEITSLIHQMEERGQEYDSETEGIIYDIVDDIREIMEDIKRK